MTTRTRWIAVALAAFIPIALIGLTTAARVGHSGLHGKSHGKHVHAQDHHEALVGKIHSMLDHHQKMRQLISDLELNDEQQGRIGSIHNHLMELHGNRVLSHGQHFAHLQQRLAQGNLDSAEARAMVDHHLEDVRQVAHRVSDELVALINSLDPQQRATFSSHLKAASQADH